jgi:hypothetical protein
MKLKERYNLDNLGNRSQEMVFDAIERLIEGAGVYVGDKSAANPPSTSARYVGDKSAGFAGGMCTCDECIADLAAWTLNHVTPRYYTSLLAPLNPDPGKDRQMRVQIELALAAGLKKLKEHPHHA